VSEKSHSSLAIHNDEPDHLYEEKTKTYDPEQCLAQTITLRTLQPTSSRNICYLCSLKVENTSLDKPCPSIGCGLGSLEIDVGDQEAPGYPEEDMLCYPCSQLDFKEIFVPRTHAGTDLTAPRRDGRAKCVLNRDISVVKKHSHCPFCRLLINTIQLNDGIESLGCVVLRG
jgi:hypothetical protein